MSDVWYIALRQSASWTNNGETATRHDHFTPVAICSNVPLAKDKARDGAGRGDQPGPGKVLAVDIDDLLPPKPDDSDRLTNATRLARKHAAAVAELAEVDPQQAYEFFEALHVECGGHADRLANAMLEDGSPRKRAEVVDEIGKLRALVDALIPVWEAATTSPGSSRPFVGNEQYACAMRDVVQAARPRVAAALAGGGVDERQPFVNSVTQWAHQAGADYLGGHVTQEDGERVSLAEVARTIRELVGMTRSSAPPQDKGRRT